MSPTSRTAAEFVVAHYAAALVLHPFLVLPRTLYPPIWSQQYGPAFAIFLRRRETEVRNLQRMFRSPTFPITPKTTPQRFAFAAFNAVYHAPLASQASFCFSSIFLLLEPQISPLAIDLLEKSSTLLALVARCLTTSLGYLNPFLLYLQEQTRFALKRTKTGRQPRRASLSLSVESSTDSPITSILRRFSTSPDLRRNRSPASGLRHTHTCLFARFFASFLETQTPSADFNAKIDWKSGQRA